MLDSSRSVIEGMILADELPESANQRHLSLPMSTSPSNWATSKDGDPGRPDLGPSPDRPILPTVAAHGPRGRRLAARYADGWNCFGGQSYDGPERLHITQPVPAGTAAMFERIAAERIERSQGQRATENGFSTTTEPYFVPSARSSLRTRRHPATSAARRIRASQIEICHWRLPAIAETTSEASIMTTGRAESWRTIASASSADSGTASLRVTTA